MCPLKRVRYKPYWVYMVKMLPFSEGGIICHECRDSETGGLKYCGQEGVEEVETDCGQDASRDGIEELRSSIIFIVQHI